jgi:hypothetical protein
MTYGTHCNTHSFIHSFMFGQFCDSAEIGGDGREHSLTDQLGDAGVREDPRHEAQEPGDQLRVGVDEQGNSCGAEFGDKPGSCPSAWTR